MPIQPIFKINSLVSQESAISAVLEIDQVNEIFNGHFPTQPVVPGACMLQIIKDVLADTLQTSLRLVKADNIKFLSLVTPSAKTLQLHINYQLTDTSIKVNASISFGDLVCMKLQATFAEV
jgi:3-hydroxyacyl-[acyl-carrier-protein] dehydratase